MAKILTVCPLFALLTSEDRRVRLLDTYNDTPYVKGMCFLLQIVEHVGSHEAFETFLRGYIERFKFKSIFANDFLSALYENFPALKEHEELYQTWLHAPGLPPRPLTPPENALTQSVHDLLDAWKEKIALPLAAAVREDRTWEALSVPQKMVFLAEFAKHAELLTPVNAHALASEYKADTSHVVDICLKWAYIVVLSGATDLLPRLLPIVRRTCKQKHLLPLYRALMASKQPEMHEYARHLVAETKLQLHPTLAGNLERLVQSNAQTEKNR